MSSTHVLTAGRACGHVATASLAADCLCQAFCQSAFMCKLGAAAKPEA